MNNIFKIFLICFIGLFFVSSDVYSEVTKKQQAEVLQIQKRFKHLMNQAHPKPNKKFLQNHSPIPFFMQSQSKLPTFLNVNMIDDESSYQARMQNESSISVNPLNPQNLISSAVDYRGESSTWVYVSHDGGNSWINHNLGKPFPGWTSTNDPSVYFSHDGVGYLCYGGFGEGFSSEGVTMGENGVFIARTFDEGLTWEPHIPVILHRGQQSLESPFEDKYYIQVDNSNQSPYLGHVYIPWKRVTPLDSATHIVISKSTNLGDDWSTPIGISNRVAGSSEDTTFGQSFPLAATGPEGEVYVVWNHGIEHSVGFVKSYDGGETWTEPRLIHKYNIFGTTTFMPGDVWRHTVKGRVRAEAYPVIICDITDGPNRGNLYLCWAADNIPNIYFSKSTDEGETWSEPIIVHSTTENDQFWQWMSIDPTNGDLSIMYLDSRNDPDNIMVEAFVSYSNDAGNTWVDRRAADISGDLRLNPFLGNSFAGDYSGCAFYDGIVYPSWIDMRSAVANIRDSDVYTAIVKVRAPSPVEDFLAQTLTAEYEKIKLTWEPPTTYSFGQAMDASEFQYIITRDGEFVTILDGINTEYYDEGLTPFEKFEYQIFVFTAQDTSLHRSSSAYAGGSRLPKAAEIISINGDKDLKIELQIRLPALRDDNVTPLANLRGLNLYRNGELINTYYVNPTDTSSIYTVNDEVSVLGYYLYQVEVFDDFEQPNTSPLSNTLYAYTGDWHSLIKEGFDNSELPLYYVIGEWNVTNQKSFSKPNSFTVSEGTHYKPNQKDTLMMFPVDITASLYISFMHASIVAINDACYIEYSIDKGNNWIELGKFNKRTYPQWDNNIFEADDWVFEEYIVKFTENVDYALVRFRFDANQFIEDLGWFIDDVVIDGDYETSVSKSVSSELLVFPNPAKEFINIRLKGHEIINATLRIYDVLGNELVNPAIVDSFESNNIKVNVSGFPQGNYTAAIKLPTGEIVHRRFVIVR